jgi:hypothetical protein
MYATKSILTICCCLLLGLSCKEGKSEEGKTIRSNKDEKSQPVPKEATKTSLLKTKTGKSIEVLVDRKNGSLNDIRIIPLDFEHTKDTFLIPDADPLSKIWLRDLDQNGFEEIYLITTAAGSGSYESVYGYASNRDSSMTPIYLPEIQKNDLEPDGNYAGYMGHDSIYIENNRLYRKYPLFKEGDENCCPSGGDKILSYELKPGEAGWLLELDRNE